MKVVGSLEYDKKTRIGQGQGQNSEVWKADEPQLGGIVAVKEIPQANLGNTAAKFFAEAQAMFSSEHRNVVPLRYACVAGNNVSLVMPYFQKGSLLDRIKTQPLPLLEVRRIGQGILAGLGRIHAGGSIHFDLKPSNVLFSDDDVPMVADFGQARRFNPSTGAVQVPDLYEDAMPPETLLQGVGTVQSDLFQMGLLLYRACNGEPLYKPQVPTVNLDDKILRGVFPNRKAFLPHVPKRLRTVIRKALQVDPVDRHGSAAEMSTALGRVPIDLDWHTTPFGSTGFEWRAKRRDQPDLVFRMVDSSTSYDVETYTESNAGLRAREKAAWRSGMARPDAFKYLEELFSAL
jgi:eukaryotic-like serine/threonine-protein kinase